MNVFTDTQIAHREQQRAILERRRALLAKRTPFWQLVTSVGVTYAPLLCRVLRRLSTNDTESPDLFEREFSDWRNQHRNGGILEFIEVRLKSQKALY